MTRERSTGSRWPAGELYISRKLIAAVTTEDDLAGVLAHENRAHLHASKRGRTYASVQGTTGKELERFTLGSPVRAARIVKGADRTLLVLTADQVVLRLPLPRPN